MTTRLPATPDYYSLKALSKLTGISHRTLRDMCDDRELTHTRARVKNKPMLFVPRAAVQRLLDDMAARTIHAATEQPDLNSRVRPIRPIRKRA